ncbi:MAG TPA: YCF48-related protein [Candidatus Binatia bacterium]|nr:YCF48-related protein [Candidatus Binatia bacterium]
MRRSPVVATSAVTAVIFFAWAATAQPPAGEPGVHHVHGLAFDRRNPDALLVATHTGLVSLVPGAAPEWIGEHRPDLMGFTPHPERPAVFFASGHPDVRMYRRDPVGNLGLLLSEDGGRTWRSLALRGQADFHALAYSPRNGGEIYGWNVAGQPGLYRVALKTNAVARLPAAGLADVLALSASPDGARLLAGTTSGLMTSEDGGRSWRPARGLPPGIPVTTVAHHPAAGRTVYAYLHGPGAGLVRSRDGGTTWERLRLVAGLRTPVVALAVGPGDRLAVATAAGDVHRSSDGGRTWRPVLEHGRPVTAHP